MKHTEDIRVWMDILMVDNNRSNKSNMFCKRLGTQLFNFVEWYKEALRTKAQLPTHEKIEITRLYGKWPLPYDLLVTIELSKRNYTHYILPRLLCHKLEI